MKPWQIRSREQEEIIQNGTLEDYEDYSVMQDWKAKTSFAVGRARYVYSLIEACERENRYCSCHKAGGSLAGLFHATELAADHRAIAGLMQVEGVASTHIRLAVDLVCAKWAARFQRMTGL